MRSLVQLSFAVFLAAASTHAQDLRLADAWPDKARYAPSEAVHIVVDLAGQAAGGEQLSASIRHLGQIVGHCQPVQLAAGPAAPLSLLCTPPAQDYRGYLVTVQLAAANGHVLAEQQTAIDVSSDWKRFPRYGYLAHYNAAEGTRPAEWMNELNRFHINGLEFYDFQYRHDQPLAGSVQRPAASWKDIAGRRVDAAVVRDLIDQAHRFNMMAMAYNASYSSYDDAFTRRDHPLPLQWAIWDSADGPRTAATAKKLVLDNTPEWATHSLNYMNQNDPGWQQYLYGQMRDLFAVYPFDGWHIDTFGERGGYAFDGSPVDYISGFPAFINHASAALHKRIVFNAVGTLGQERIARSAAEFVYSELWDDNETYDGILSTVEQVHYANPHDGYVLAAYVHKEPLAGPAPTAKQFNMPSVLLADAAIFASGAAHIELGDGDRMLYREYFPADTRLSVSPALRQALRHYYDFLTAYENYLRDDLDFDPCGVQVEVDGQFTNPRAVPASLWTLARRKDSTTIVHLINLLGTNDAHWRDSMMTRPEPPTLLDLHVRIASPGTVSAVGWASPDVDGGAYHAVPFHLRRQGASTWVELTLPSLHYWDTIFIEHRPNSPSPK